MVYSFVLSSFHVNLFSFYYFLSVLTYRAASGALAVLSSSEKVCNQIIKVLLSNILSPSDKCFSTAKRARAFSSVRVHSQPLLVITHDTRPRAAVRLEALVTRMAFTPHTVYVGAQNSEL